MADRDDIEDWLSERIDPLPPPPGTFDLIKRRARRRKYRRLAITASTAAVIVAAAVTVPQVVKLPVLSPSGTTGVAAGHPASATATGAGGTQSIAASRPPAPAATSTQVAPSAPVPPNFRPTSVTFVGAGTGWVIGQAGTPGQCATAFCTSVARTDNAGKTWSGVGAPLTGAPDGATGVSQIRFLNTEDGWAFGPGLFFTGNGGRSWSQVSTDGLRVTDLETVGQRVFALFASCTGGGTSFGAACTDFTLYSSPASASAWAPVGASTTGLTDRAAHEAASLVLTGSRGFLLGPGGAVYAGPVDGSGAWSQVNSISAACPVGPVQPDGQPAGALMTAVSARELILACATGASQGAKGSGSPVTQQKLIFSSPNGAGSWLAMATAPRAGLATAVAASPSATVVLATDQGIDVLPAGDISWQTASLAGGGPAGGFSYVGMTTDAQGVALPANPAPGTVWFTYDGGQSWQPSHLNGS
jgi:hypothetical protein